MVENIRGFALGVIAPENQYLHDLIVSTQNTVG